MSSVSPLLCARGLVAAPRGVRPGDRPVIGPLDLELSSGERVSLLGANGAGKSTLLCALAGLVSLRAGRITFAAQGPREASGAALVAAKDTALVLQNPETQFVTVSVDREIALGLEFLGRSSAEIRARVDATLRAFHLEELRRRPTHRLSGGEKQRTAIAAMTALEPRVLLLDEASAFLDARGRESLRRTVRELVPEVALFRAVSHTEEALDDGRACILDHGAIVADGPAADILADVALLRQNHLQVPALVGLRHELETRGIVAAAGGCIEGVDAMMDAMIDNLAATHNVVDSRGAWPGVPASPSPRVHASYARSRPSGGDALVAEGLHFAYRSGQGRERDALSDVSVILPRGEVTALIGGSGAGKSTLLTVLAGLEAPDRGRVESPRFPRVGVLFQFAEDQMVADSLFEDVAYGPRRAGVPEEETWRRVSGVLAGLGFDDSRFHVPLDSLSYGERRLAALAGVLALEPDYLLLDEPTAGLDHASRAAVARILEGLAGDGCGVLLASHDLDLAAAVAGRGIVLREGRLANEGPMSAILTNESLLRDAGLEAPALARLLSGLRERGFPVPWPARLTTAYTADAIAGAMVLAGRGEGRPGCGPAKGGADGAPVAAGG